MCECVCSQTWYSVRLLDFSGNWDEALETGSVFPSYSLQSVKADMRRPDSTQRGAKEGGGGREEGRVKRRDAVCDVCVKWEDLGDRINPREY